MRRIIFLLISVLYLGVSSLLAQDAAEILDKMDAVIFAPEDKQAVVEITTYKKGEVDKVREAIMKEKGADKKVYRYTQPENQAGIATLSLPGEVMWMKMPAFESPKRISMLAKSQALNNTDFAWEDIPRQPYAERYNPTLTGTELNTYVLELVPKTDKSNYSKLMVYVDKANYYPVRIDYFDKAGNKEKEAHYEYKKVGKYWNASEVTMTDLKRNTATKITMKEVRFDQGIPESIFTPEEFWK